MSRDGKCVPDPPDAGRRLVVTAGLAGVAGLPLAAAADGPPPRAEAAPATPPDAARPVDVALLTHAGGAHLTAYLRALAASPAVAGVRVADPDGAILGEARAILGAKLAGADRDHAAALADPVPGMALVSMEAVAAPPTIRRALERGCHVLAEKPACTNAADFSALAALADARGRHLMLALANRLNPEVVEARRLLAAGAIGRPLAVEMHLVQDRTRLERPAYQGSWFADPVRAGGGHLAWLGIHWLDLAMHLVGAPIDEVTAFTANVGGQPVRIEDSAVVLLRFAGGALGSLAGGYWLDAGFQSHLRVWGSGGWLSIDGGDPATLRLRADGDPAEGRTVRTEAPGDAYSIFVHAAAEALARGVAPPIDAADSLRVVRTVYAAYRSAGEGRSVRVADVGARSAEGG